MELFRCSPSCGGLYKEPGCEASSAGLGIAFVFRPMHHTAMNLYIFGWPSCIGGGSTRLAHLLPLLAGEFKITMVPPDKQAFADTEWIRALARCGIEVEILDSLPLRLEGWALGICNADFLKTGLITARERGLRVVWSNEMMWHFPSELGAVSLGCFDLVLYVSEIQRQALEPGYASALLGARSPVPAGAREGWIQGGVRRLRWAVIDNFVDPGSFPFKDRFAESGWETRSLTVGRLSRADPAKFPEDFPGFYEGLGLRNPHFRVMGWSESLARRWKDHHFGPDWTLLPEASESQVTFLHSLDIFVYSLSGQCRESWGRAVVEAMLTGAVPLVPSGAQHHLRNLIIHGVSGFLCDGPEDYGRYARLLHEDPELRKRMSHDARRDAVERLCNADTHRADWRRALMDGWSSRQSLA
ncbi:MAG: glycosyltransferase [Verrucomicrobiaceae bacterium]|nr:MAG: glycosyltransferase [Verrucomicrobiaceae bacterium]